MRTFDLRFRVLLLYSCEQLSLEAAVFADVADLAVEIIDDTGVRLL